MKRAILAALAITALAAAALAAMVGGGIRDSSAADHVDAPGLMPPGGNLQLDITDVYAFRARNGNTVLAMNVNGLTAAGKRPVFASGVPTVVADEGRHVLAPHRQQRRCSRGRQPGHLVLEGEPQGRSDDDRASQRQGLASGLTCPGKAVKVNRAGAVRAYAGLREDPFFFDLDGFIDILSTESAKSFLGCTNPRTDFFAGKNVSAIVLELPSAMLRVGSTTSASGRPRPSAVHRSTGWGGPP